MLLPWAAAAHAAHNSASNSPAFFDTVRDEARRLAGEPFKPRPQAPLPESLAKLNYDQYQRIGARPEDAPWARAELPFAIQLMHRGYLFKDGVEIHLIETGAARRLEFSPSLFNYGSLALPLADLGNLDFAGFRVMHGPRPEDMPEVASFIGASYFRFIGKDQHYGSSARGLAVDTGEERGEEFPRFTKFWLEKPRREAAAFTLLALLESPSVTGAYQFIIRPGLQTSVAVEASLFARAGDRKFGLAPLTSMFLMGENRSRMIPDFRPEVHDCDGLLVVAQGGERFWRPITNPERKHRISRIETGGLEGFGLLQRDRDFRSYEDLEAGYEKRPGFWVTPSSNWGKGRVELVEIPTANEYNDNVVAYWVLEAGLPQGQEFQFGYSIATVGDSLGTNQLLSVSATRIAPEHDDKPPRFVIDFAGANSASAKSAGPLQAKVSASQGEIRNAVVQTNTVTAGWRLIFDLAGAREKHTTLKASLSQDGTPASETWMYHFEKP